MTSLFGESYQQWITGVQTTIGPVALILIIIAIALLGGFGITRLCKLLKIPYVSGYIILGILLGPSLLAFIPYDLIVGQGATEIKIGYAGLSFLTDMTMGFIAFGCGRYFKHENFKSAGPKVIIVSALTAITVGLIAGGISYLIYGVAFNKADEYGLAPAFLFGAVAACISPTATTSIIRQYKAKGPFVERIFQNILVANIVAILAFSFILGLVTSGLLGGGVVAKPGVNPAYEAFKPLISNIVFIGLGILFAFILSKLNNYRRTNDSRIILTIAFTTILVALCSTPWENVSHYIPFSKISPLLPCMAFGILYFNLSKSESLFIQLENFLPPILCLFFVVSGAKLQLDNFQEPAIVVCALMFVISRTIAQFGSAASYGKAFKCPAPNRIYLPLTMLTMTSVAVGLVNLASDMIKSNEMIVFVYTVVMTACVILEIVGPVFAKNALVKTSSIDPAVLASLKDPNSVRNAQTNSNVSD